MENDYIVSCERCGATRVHLVYKYVNVMSIVISICEECKYSSQAWDFISDPVVLQNYVDDYKRCRNITNSNEDMDLKFKEGIIDTIKKQISKTFLINDKNKVLREETGYFVF